MRHKAVKELFHYWNGLRGDRTAPERNDMDPNAIRNILADTFQLDIDADRTFPFSLAGTRVNALFGAEQKGRSFLELWRREEARNLATVLMTVADGACPVVAGAVAAPEGESEVALELLILPLRHYGKTHSRILGIITPLKSSSWLGTSPLGPVGLRSLRVVEAEDMPIQVSAEPPSRDRRPLILRHPLRSPPSLQVIEGGRSHNATSQGDIAGTLMLRRELEAMREDKSRK